MEETLAPLAYDLPRHIESLSDLIIVKALSSEQDDLGADDIAMRCRILAGHLV
jgi:hypothetical protein